MELDAFVEPQKKWQLYCNAWADFVAGERANSGTIWPLIHAGTARRLVDSRLEEVGNWMRLGDSY